MAVDIDENDQNDKLKEIWSSYKNFIFIGFALLLVIYAGVYVSSKQTRASNELASQLYQEVLIEKIENTDKIKLKVEILKKDHLNTPYAGRAALHYGQLLAKSGNFDESINELNWVSENATEQSIRSLSLYALSLNYIVKKDIPNAKISAETISSKGFEALKMDLLGDIYSLEGNSSEAKKAYLIALEFYKDKNELAQVIQTKIDAIGK